MGYKLKDIRIAMNITQKELAKKSGVSRAIISGIESGRISITTTGTIRKLASALGVSVSDIFMG